MTTKEPQPRPVTEWRNEELDGNALCVQSIWEDHKAEVEKARAQQARYEASLPQDRDEAIRQAWTVLHPDDEESLKGLDVALHALTAIHTIARHELDNAARDTRDAVVFLAWEASNQLREAIATLDHAKTLVGAAYRSAPTRE